MMYELAPAPDWQWLHEIAERAQQIERSGKMDRDTWRKLYAEAWNAVRDQANAEFVGFMGSYTHGPWLKEANQEARDNRPIMDTIPPEEWLVRPKKPSAA